MLTIRVKVIYKDGTKENKEFTNPDTLWECVEGLHKGDRLEILEVDYE